MERISIFLLIITGLLAMSGCNKSDESSTSSNYSSTTTVTSTPADDGKLTTAKAQSTLSRWVKRGQVTVRGIQEFSKENAAKADIEFSDFTYKSNDGLGESEKNYSVRQPQYFTHYNDGRWMLSKITIERGFLDSVSWNNLNVEVR